MDRTAEWADLRAWYLRPKGERPTSSARGVHHTALLSSDVERTIRFCTELLGFPLTELFENRDYPGSTHFFFDLGNGNALAYFDLPGLDLGPYREGLGGLHHLAISMAPAEWQVAEERGEGHLVLDVIDRGPGIPEEERRRIFDMFYSAETGDRRGPRGTGLGLTIVRGMVGAHGGRVEAQAGPGGVGTRIRVTIPLVEPP